MSMLNPPPADKTPAPRLYKPQGTLKRDINLLPANPMTAKAARGGLIAMGALAVALVIAYFAILQPALALKLLQGQATEAENQAVLLAPAEADSLAKMADRDAKAQILAFVTGGQAGYAQPYDVMAELSKACPGGITLTSFKLNAAGITVGGYAGNDAQIADFLVNMKAVFPQYADVLLVFSKGTGDDVDKRWSREFQATASAAGAAAAEAAPETVKEGDAQ